jgi:hypothetical protein
MNKPVSYSEDNHLLETDLYQRVQDFIQGGSGAKNQPKAFSTLKEVFGLPLGQYKAKKAKKKS